MMNDVASAWDSLGIGLRIPSSCERGGGGVLGLKGQEQEGIGSWQKFFESVDSWMEFVEGCTLSATWF